MHNVNMCILPTFHLWKRITVLVLISFVFLMFVFVMCSSTESDNVKTNLVHKRHHVWKFKTPKLPIYKTLISVGDYTNCENRCNNFWLYPLTIEVFTQLFYKISPLPFLYWYFIYSNTFDSHNSLHMFRGSILEYVLLSISYNPNIDYSLKPTLMTTKAHVPLGGGIRRLLPNIFWPLLTLPCGRLMN